MTERAVRVALLQMTSGIDAAANAECIAEAIAAAAEQGAEMLFTPEMALLLDRDRTRAAMSVAAGGAVDQAIARLAQAAARHAIWLHIGSAPLPDPSVAPRWRNRSLLIDPAGSIVAHYDKLHMFDVALDSGESWRESAGYAAGDALTAASATPLGKLGLTICYDLRFAALYDALGAAGCDSIAVPAAFTVPTGAAHWHVLLRARAIEQGCHVIAAAQCGLHADGRTTYGHSLVVDPWGDIVFDGGTEPGLAVVPIDVDAPARVRRQLPALQHRRPLPGFSCG